MDKKSKKNLIIRVVVYSTLIIAAVFVMWFSITAQPLGAHKFWMKIKGIEFCETPEEAIKLYAEALIKGDRDEALEYVYKPKYEHNLWDAHKRQLYEDFTDEQLKQRGERILNGYMEKEGSETAEWVVIHYIDGETVGGSIDIWNTGYDGWKIH